MSGRIQILDAHDAASADTVRRLFRDYQQWLGQDLCFQGFEKELATLPGKYAPPQGAILIAWVNDEAAGCVGLRPLEPGVCEMKRLWVADAFRNLGLGRRLADEIINRARVAGYERMRLDTLGQMKAARALYKAHDFYEIPAYYDNPGPDVIYLEKRLNAGGKNHAFCRRQGS